MTVIKQANVKCPNGHVVSVYMRYCPICGSKIIYNGIHFCPNCGKERHSTDNYCVQCGYSFIQKKQKEKNDDFSFFGFLWID